jgi:hypothetical protein
MAGTKFSVDLAAPVVERLRLERNRGVAMNRLIEAAVYWYTHHLTPRDRELARLCCESWIQQGTPPDPRMVAQLDASLLAVEPRDAPPPARRGKAGGNRG